LEGNESEKRGRGGETYKNPYMWEWRERNIKQICLVVPWEGEKGEVGFFGLKGCGTNVPEERASKYAVELYLRLIKRKTR